MAPGYEDVYGVHVHRVFNPVKTHPMASVLTYAMTAATQMKAEASMVIHFYRQHWGGIDVVHCHEWLTIPPAVILKHAFNIPFVLAEGSRRQS